MDYREGTKKEVAEIKFLIHDLRVERFINEVIHFHVTLNTDLEIYSIEQAQILHGHDLQVLKTSAVNLRKAFHEYSAAVKNFSPDRSILRAGKHYVDTIRSICALILNPLWGRVADVLVFLPSDSRSARSHTHYQNCLHWIGGVSKRIESFFDEQQDKGIYEEFDLASELEELTRDVIHGYVMEQSASTVDLQLKQLDSAVIGGNRARFRRMYFNLVMNAVDALADQSPGIIETSATAESERVILRVRDNGAGMPPEKIGQLLTDKKTLDGELHSLGFVFVRQTIREFAGELSIQSEVGKGTTMTIIFPTLAAGQDSPPSTDGRKEKEALTAQAGSEQQRPATAGNAEEIAPPAQPSPVPVPAVRSRAKTDGDEARYGQIVFQDYEVSEAEYPGCLFAISITNTDLVDFFTHRPYDRWWNMGHDDLTPMYYEAVVRGRLEEDDDKQPGLILKEPQSVQEYFDFKQVPEGNRTAETHLQMVHDEYIRIGRKLMKTGLSPDMPVELTSLQKYFPGRDDLLEAEPFPLRVLAEQSLSNEESG